MKVYKELERLELSNQKHSPLLLNTRDPSDDTHLRRKKDDSAKANQTMHINELYAFNNTGSLRKESYSPLRQKLTPVIVQPVAQAPRANDLSQERKTGSSAYQQVLHSYQDKVKDSVEKLASALGLQSTNIGSSGFKSSHNDQRNREDYSANK